VTTYPGSVEFLYALGNEIKSAKLGLDRIGALLEALERPERSCRLVHVAGTNGKGSTCAMIEAGLRAAGFRTGLYTSPHLIEPVERIRIQGKPVTREQFAAAFETVHRKAEEMLAAGALDCHPTYFETVTAMGLLLFREMGVEWAVLEVGLGGRLDATNVVTPELCVITQIDFDHEAYLGRGLDAIAGEKAGIIKRGVPVVTSAQRPEADAVLASRAEELGAEQIRSSEWSVKEPRLHAYGSEFRAVKGTKAIYVRCPLAGRHQVENAVTAVAALDRLGIAGETIERGIAGARWPGRLERVSEKPDVILDGAHNPAGARALRAHIEEFFRGGKVWLIYGAMRDKAVEEMAGILFPAASEVIATAPRQPRAARPETLAACVNHPRLRVAPDLKAALALTREAAPEDAVFITGSLFLVGEAYGLL
jgi:dihydrofolate synthase / folylpolyglutamate synthase